MYVRRKSRFRKHHPPRILPNEVRKTPSIPVRRVWKNVLFDKGHAVLPSSASKSYFRCGRRAKSRGRQHCRDCSRSGERLEYCGSLARDSGASVSSIQPRDGIRRRGVPGRRDSHVRGQQEDAELDLRCDRGLVSALALPFRLVFSANLCALRASAVILSRVLRLCGSNASGSPD